MRVRLSLFTLHCCKIDSENSRETVRPENTEKTLVNVDANIKKAT